MKKIILILCVLFLMVSYIVADESFDEVDTDQIILLEDKESNEFNLNDLAKSGYDNHIEADKNYFEIKKVVDKEIAYSYDDVLEEWVIVNDRAELINLYGVDIPNTLMYINQGLVKFEVAKKVWESLLDVFEKESEEYLILKSNLDFTNERIEQYEKDKKYLTTLESDIEKVLSRKWTVNYEEN